MATGNVLSKGVFVVAAKRTPFGTFGGSLKGHSPVDLQVLASNAAMASIGLKPEQVNSVCIGNVLNASSPDAPYLARHVALRCGMPVPREELQHRAVMPRPAQPPFPPLCPCRCC